MQQQLAVGRMGVHLATTILQKRYPIIEDLQSSKSMQKRGVDLFVEGLGYLEVKTDTHSPERVFLELDVGGKPGAVDRSCADYFCVLFPGYRVLYLMARAELQQWLREKYAWIAGTHPDWVKTVHSKSQQSTWSARGVVVPRVLLAQGVNLGVIEWEEGDENLEGKRDAVKPVVDRDRAVGC